MLFAGGRTDSAPSGVVDIYNVRASDCNSCTLHFTTRLVVASPHFLRSRLLGHGLMINFLNLALI